MLRSLSLDALALPVALLVYGLLMAWTALPAQATPLASPAPAPGPSPLPAPGYQEPPQPPLPGLDTLLFASWYGEDHRGQLTASGELFNPDDLTCAHRLLPFGTRLRLTLGDRMVEVRVNDRGPYHKDPKHPELGFDRDLDVSQAAAERLGFTVAGLAWLEVEVVP